MKFDEGIVSRSSYFSPVELASSFVQAQQRLAGLLIRHRAGISGFNAIEGWCHEVRAWVADLFVLDAMLSCDGYRTPLRMFEDNPDRFIIEWAAFFDKVSAQVMAEAGPFANHARSTPAIQAMVQ